MKEGRSRCHPSHRWEGCASGGFDVRLGQDIDAGLVCLVESFQDGFIWKVDVGLEAMVKELVGKVFGNEIGH